MHPVGVPPLDEYLVSYPHVAHRVVQHSAGIDYAQRIIEIDRENAAMDHHDPRGGLNFALDVWDLDKVNFPGRELAAKVGFKATWLTRHESVYKLIASVTL